jgi:archaellum component FlaC
MTTLYDINKELEGIHKTLKVIQDTLELLTKEHITHFKEWREKNDKDT